MVLQSAFSQSTSMVDIHPLIQNQAINGDSIPCFIVLTRQAADIEVSNDLSKVEKTTHMYNVLSILAANTQGPITDSLDSWNVSYRSYYIVNAIRAILDSVTLIKVKDLPGIQSILPDFPLVTPSEPMETGDIRRMDTLLHWGIGHIGADQVWERGITGQDVVIAGLDTGMEWDHEFLKQSYRGWQADGPVNHHYNWHDAIHQRIYPAGTTIQDTIPNPCGLSTNTPCDDHGHGTFTMGLVTGSHDSRQLGIAPGARWIGCRVMDRGIGILSTYLSGLEWCLAPTDQDGLNPKPALAPDIITNSWGCPHNEGCIPQNYWMLDSAASRLTRAGILVIASAGNNGQEGCGSLVNPLAIFPSVFTVGATDKQDSITAFSSRGTSISNDFIKPDVVAPGQGITSIYPGGRFRTSNGTSISAPLVAGIAALVLEANPKLRGHPELIREIITQSAVPLNENPCTAAQHPNPVYGYGRVDAEEAIELARTYHPTPASDLNLTGQILIYPNPARDILHIFNQHKRSGQLAIYNAQGHLMRSMSLAGEQARDIVITGLPVGFYFVRFTTTKGTTVKKMLKI